MHIERYQVVMDAYMWAAWVSVGYYMYTCRYMIPILVDFLFTSGLTLGVGSSTFALIFYIRALEDGTIDPSEKKFMHTVYFVLRIGMVLITLGLLGKLYDGSYALITKAYHIQWALMAIILVNAILMTYKKMPMQIGPVLAGGSWYSLFFVTALPLATLPYGALACFYIIFLTFFFMVYRYLRCRYAKLCDWI